MKTKPLFVSPDSQDRDAISILFEGERLRVPSGINVAAALFIAGVREFRSSPVSHTARAPYCMMGICFECLVEIDGVPTRQSCMVTVQEGMQIRRQIGAADLDRLTVGDAA